MIIIKALVPYLLKEVFIVSDDFQNCKPPFKGCFGVSKTFAEISK